MKANPDQHNLTGSSQDKQVLIVEDDLAFAVSLEIMLLRRGMKVIIKSHIPDVWSTILSNRVDIILMDVHLSQSIDGIELASEIKDFNIPIIFLTADASDSTFLRAQQVSLVPFLTKPVSQYTLFSVIDNLLSPKNPATETAQNQAEGQLMTGNSFIYVKRGSKHIKLMFDAILYLKTDGNYVRIVLKGGSAVPVSIPMKAVLAKLPPAVFVQIHRKYVVNINAVESVSVSTNEVNVDQAVLPFSRTYKWLLLKSIETRK